MGSNPVNLAIRFLLEMAALISFGMFGESLNESWSRWIFAIAFPVIAAAIWASFAVPHDPSRSGKAPVPIPGAFRLVLELLFFLAAVLVLRSLGYPLLALILSATVLLHYLVSYDRLAWLIRTRPGEPEQPDKDS